MGLALRVSDTKTLVLFLRTSLFSGLSLAPTGNCPIAEHTMPADGCKMPQE